jgi:hypothetical protein
LSNALDAAIYSTLTGDTGAGGVNTLATGGIHQMIAPQAAGLPRVIFQEILNTPSYSFKQLISDHVYYQLKALAADTPTDEGVTMAGTIAERMRTVLLNASLNGSIYCRMQRSIPVFAEWDDANSRHIYHKGFICEIWQ